MSQPSKKSNTRHAFKRKYHSDKGSIKDSKKSSRKTSRKNKTPANHPAQAQLPIVTLIIDNLLHDGRGVGVYSADNPEHPSEKVGKKVFVSHALPNETVKVQITKVKKSMEEGDCLEVIGNPHPQRQTPICQHFGSCGGCSLQHLQVQGQIAFKQSVLAEHLAHQANISPDDWLSPIVSDKNAEQTGYRTKARIGVRHIPATDRYATAKTIIGLRERGSNRLTNIDDCPILDTQVNSSLTDLKGLIESLDTPDAISHLQVAVGELLPEQSENDKTVAIIIRHLKPFNKNDLNKLNCFFSERNWQLYLQDDKGVQSINLLFDKSGASRNLPLASQAPCSSNQANLLAYQLPEFNLSYQFFPTDFTQVNMSVNQQMVKLACDLLALQTGERVLDLFSGLGNFSLAMARCVGGSDGDQGIVIGVEGSDRMTQRAKGNARLNQLHNTQFYTHNLTQDLSKTEWANQHEFDALLIDPPRSGAWEVMQYLPKFNAKRIVYVSCNPATLARDSKALIEAGYQLTHAGVMDMFCHTGHVESIARFEKKPPHSSDILIEAD